MHRLVGTVSGVFDFEGHRVSDTGHVRHVARRPDEWWAVGDRGVWHSGELVTPAPPGVIFNCVRPTGDTVWIGADRARLFRLEGGELLEDRAFTDAPGREDWYTPWGGPPDVRSMSIDRNGDLYVNVHVGGIVRYGGDGPVPTLDIDADVHQVTAHPDRSGVVLAACARGLAQSENGHDFRFRTEGLSHLYCRAVAVHDESILLSSSRGPGGGDARVWFGRIGGGGFAPAMDLPAFAGNIDSHCVLAGPDGYFVGHRNSVWGSNEAAGGWRRLVEEIPDVTCLA
jgi:hypothetical protein